MKVLLVGYLGSNKVYFSASLGCAPHQKFFPAQYLHMNGMLKMATLQHAQLKGFFINQIKITTKITTRTIIIYCVVSGVGRHTVIKPPPKTAPKVSRNICSFFYSKRIYRTLSLKRGLSSVRKKRSSQL